MKQKPLKGTVSVPGDKSISHRALIFSTLLDGTTEIRNCSSAVDCESTAACLSALGIGVNYQTSASAARRMVKVQAQGLSSLSKPSQNLFAGNSGTTIRLLSGLLAGQPFDSILDGDRSLRKRPMLRITEPLEKMGARVEFLSNGQTVTPQTSGYAPFSIKGGKLTGQVFNLPIASAQVETAILLAGLQAEGITTVHLPAPVRDHTRRMFQFLTIPVIHSDERSISVRRLTTFPQARLIEVPADMSSAAFFIVAACLIEGSHILLKDVGMNPGRLLALEVLQSMGAGISIENRKAFGSEPVADLRIRYQGRLRGTTIRSAQIARGIDEIPILALAGALCQGSFSVSGAGELKHKESDRLKTITENLQAAGADITVQEDGFVMQGQDSLAGGSRWHTHEDHRLAMTGAIANLVCQEELDIEEIESVKISYPSFATDLAHLRQ